MSKGRLASAVKGRPFATILLSIASVTVIVLAATASGIPSDHVSANDGGVWVVNDNPGSGNQGSFGELNVPIGELGATFGAPGKFQPSYNLNVRQDGTTVLAIDEGRGKVYPVDVATGTPAVNAGATFQPGGKVELGGGVAAILDPATGSTPARIWAGEVGSGPEASLAGLGSAAKPTATLKGGVALAVDAAGDVYVASSTELLTLPDAGGHLGTPHITPFNRPLHSVSLTAVGTTPVVLDQVDHVMLFPLSGMRTALTTQTGSASSLVLQQAGPAAESVLVASSSALFQVPLGGGSPSTLATVPGAGPPAKPVRLDGCAYGAWAGAPGYSVEACPGGIRQGKLPSSQNGSSALSKPVFRVNNNQILLNDEVNGSVWTVAGRVDQVLNNLDWLRVLAGANAKQSTNSQHHGNTSAAQKQAPKVVNVTLSARAGRDSILHILDQDSDPGGSILSIVGVSPSSGPGFSVQVSPDTQTASISLAAGVTNPVSFEYEVIDGFGLTAQANVTVDPTTAETPPYQLAGAPQPTEHVVSGGTVSLQVLGNWRDHESDPISLASASVPAGQGQITWTSDGILTYTAPVVPADTPVSVTYEVTDGRSAPVTGQVPLIVLGRGDTTPYPPTGVPDAAKIVVGQPTPLSPLANDIFGADPNHPSAKLALAGPVSSTTGLTVATNVSTGQLTLTATQPGTYSLQYEATYGSATSAPTQILVQAVAPSGTPQEPITTPVSVLLHGQLPATVDVLQSDYDPSGGLLSVVGVEAPPGIQASIVQGAYLRILATGSSPAPNQIITYQVTNGVTAPVTGQVTVLWSPPLPEMPPIALPTYAVVQAGDEVNVPVLSAASDPDGESVFLLPGGSPSAVTLSRTNPGTQPYPGGLGAASISGGELRYAAPPGAGVKAPESITVSYVVESQGGERTTGQTFVTVNPVDAATDTAPAPADVNARVTAGGQITIPIQTTGVDSSGDSVAVTGIVDPPQLGRIMSINAGSITYQAYPTSAGTDTFTYQVEDPYGLTGQAVVRVGVTPPAQTQAPVALDEYITAAPGAVVDVNLLASDIIAPGDRVTVEPLAKTDSPVPSGTKLVGSGQDVLQVTAPSGAAPKTVTYGITDGSSSPSLAQVVIRSQPGYRSPPIAADYFPRAPAPGAKSITVDVLAKDSDPSGPASDLTVVRGFNPTVAVHGGKVAIPVTANPRSVPYEIRSRASGATAIGVVHVLGSGVGPQLVAGKVIEVPRGGTTSVNVDDYISDPAHAVRLVTQAGVSDSPSVGLSEHVVSNTGVQLHGVGTYDGPGSLTVEVTDGTSLSDTHAHTATLSIPVQVGRPTPVVRCPSTPVTVIQGGPAIDLNIASVCQVWTPNGSSAGQLTYTASWSTPAAGVNLGWQQGQTGRVLSLQAQSGARGGATGRIVIGVTGAGATGDSVLAVQVEGAPLASVAAIDVPGVETGHTATINLDQYVTSPLAQPQIKVLSVNQTSSGSARVTEPSAGVVDIQPLTGTHGTMTFAIRLTDEPSQPQRVVTGTISLQVLDVPGAPGPLQGVPGNNQIALSWTPAAANGAPVDYYVVSMGGSSVNVQGTSYTWTQGLQNGTPYTFKVTAHNQVGLSLASASGTFSPQSVPDAPTSVTATGGDQQATIQWAAPFDNGQPISGYTISVTPGPGSGATTEQVGGNATSYTWQGLDNAIGPYTFTVVAHNSVGPSPTSSPSNSVYAHGTPATPTAPTATGAVSTDQTTTTVTVSWPAINQCNDAQPCAKYVVTELKGGAVVTQDTTTGTCSGASLCANFGPITNDGSSYTYELQAVNVEGQTSAPSPPSSPAVVAAGIPGPITDLSASPGNTAIKVTFTLPPSHGASIAKVDYTVTGGPSTITGDWASPGGSGQSVSEPISGLSNGVNYSVTVNACNEVGECGSASNTATADPYGPPDPPSVSASASGNTITFSWSGGGNNGRPVQSYTYCIDGSSSCTTRYSAGSTPITYGCGQTHSITAFVTDTAGQDSSDSTPASAATSACAPPPSPSITASQGSAGSGIGCASGCDWLNFTVNNFPTGSYSWKCISNGSVSFNSASYGYTVKVSAANENFDAGGYCLFGSGETEKIEFDGVTSNGVVFGG